MWFPYLRRTGVADRAAAGHASKILVIPETKENPLEATFGHVYYVRGYMWVISLTVWPDKVIWN
jgi:rRNA maturation protein Rpf1